jgi:hypothetical protein
LGVLFVLFTSSCDPILLSLGAASHAVGVLWNDAATGRNSCFTRVTWVRRTKRVNIFRTNRVNKSERRFDLERATHPLETKRPGRRKSTLHKRFALPPLTPCISFCCPDSTFTDPQSTTDGKFWTGKHFLHFNRRKGKIKNPSTHLSSHFSIFPVNQLKPHTPVHIARTRTGRPSYSRPSCLYSRCVSKNVGAQ